MLYNESSLTVNKYIAGHASSHTGTIGKTIIDFGRYLRKNLYLAASSL